MMRRHRLSTSLAAFALAVLACSAPPTRPDQRPKPTQATAHTISILGTNDLHGALERLPVLAGYVANLRAVREADGGSVLLLDGGDMFQGTLESNTAEGADVVRAYNQIGYTAVAVGNHEFDYGPSGPAATAKSADDDPRGALKARIAEAKFPFVVANILDQKTGQPLNWPNVQTSTIVETAGFIVGIIGASTESTPYTTMPANFVGLQMVKPAQAIVAEASALRARGAQLVIVTAHIGSNCKDFADPNNLGSCEQKAELFDVLRELPHGTIDVFIGGHTHAGVAHRINGIAVIESFSSGRAFGRVDLRIGPSGRVTAVEIHKPRSLCEGEGTGNPMPVAECKPGDYEGKPVVADPAVQKIVDEAVARAGKLRDEKLGVTLTAVVKRSYGSESAEGNLFTDLMRAARPDAQIAVTNGGGLRADLPAGELTYGQLFEAMPFDNRFALVEVTGEQLRAMVTGNLQKGGGILSWSGLKAVARCKDGKLDIAITVGKKPLSDRAKYKVVTSDFLASGGDGLIGKLKLPETAIKPSDAIIRDAIADVLRKRKGTIDPSKLVSPSTRRLDFDGSRPVGCGATSPTSAPTAASKEEAPE